MRANATFSSDLTSVNSIIRLVAEVIFKTWYNALDTRWNWKQLSHDKVALAVIYCHKTSAKFIPSSKR